jgi:prophage maintenance system killer protein
MQEPQSSGNIVIYKSSQGPELKLNLRDETVWMSQEQISELFQTDRSSITKHIKNIIESGELHEKSNVQILHIAKSDKPVRLYNLDFILSVGYRVNSKKATQFRIWATQKLRDYLLKGYVVNEKILRESQDAKLRELQQAHLFIRQALEAKRLSGYEKELASIINDYTQTWVMLNRYDEGDFEVTKKTSKKIEELDYVKAKKAIEHFKDRLVQQDYATGTFGREHGTVLKDLLADIAENKVSLENKAATLFYTIIKKRPFLDGNKRVASLLFVVFLIENHYLYDKKGERKFNDNGLIALALLVEETKSSEKDTLIKLIANLTHKK